MSLANFSRQGELVAATRRGTIDAVTYKHSSGRQADTSPRAPSARQLSCSIPSSRKMVRRRRVVCSLASSLSLPTSLSSSLSFQPLYHAQFSPHVQRPFRSCVAIDSDKAIGFWTFVSLVCILVITPSRSSSSTVPRAAIHAVETRLSALLIIQSTYISTAALVAQIVSACYISEYQATHLVEYLSHQDTMHDHPSYSSH